MGRAVGGPGEGKAKRADGQRTLGLLNFIMAAQSSLYNEERNLLRIQAKERRNQEVPQESERFPPDVPLFGEPYKIKKTDELSSRIQKMFGNYDDIKEFITTKSHQNFIGIPKNAMSLIPQHKPDHPLFPEKTNNVLPPSFQNPSHHHRPFGPLNSGGPSSGNSVPYQKFHSRIEPASQTGGMSSNQKQGQGQSCKPQEVQSSRCQKKSERCIEEDIANELQASLLELSPLLSKLSSPVAPLSPLHSSQRLSSRSHGNSNKNHGQKSSPLQNLVGGTQDNETLDSLSAPVAVNAQPSSQTFPPSLPSQTRAIQQKPTAYVRPMDGQDQAPDESPELKPPPEEYHEQSYEKINLKAKTKLSKLKIPAEPIEQSFSNEVHCVEEILKEMTHSWPPPLTAIHTPSTAEPSKFPFPAKESQHTGSVIQSQKQYDAPSKTLSASSQQGTSTLQDDLHVTDSEDDDDDQVSDKPSSSSTPPSVPQSQPENVVLGRSSSPESGSTSDSDSSSDSESESSSSDSEANDPPTRASTPEPDPQSNRWQLNNWLTKVNQPVSPPENFLEDDGSRGSLQEDKGPGKTSSSHCSSSSDSSKNECPLPTDSRSKSSSKAPRSAQEVHLPTKRSYQKPPAPTEEPARRQVVGSKQPKKSSKAPVQEEPKRGLKVESEPPGPYGAKDQSSKDKPKVKTKERPKASEKKELKPAPSEPLEKKKHKSSHQTPVKCPDREAGKDHVVGSALEQVPLSPITQSPRVPATSRTGGAKQTVFVREELHRDKFFLPIRDKKLLSPLRDCPAPQALVVKIDLALLLRIPQLPGKGACPKRREVKEGHGMKKQDVEKRSTDAPSKSLKKRKQEDALRDDQKKIKLEKETKSSSSGHKDSSKNKISKPSMETPRKEMPLPPPLSPTQPAQKPAKTAQKRPKSESGACSQLPGPSIGTAKSKESHKDSSSSKHRKMEGKPSESSKSNKGSAEDVPNPFPVPSLPNGTSKPMKPQSKPHKQHPVEYHLKEAKRLKHKADAMTDKVGKAFKYLDAALSFIECGIAMESDTLSPKPAYTMFAETIDLIKFIMTLKSFTDSSTTTQEKIFFVLCMRCQAILYMAMFRYKKDTAIKYSRTLNEHFKSSSRITQAPSPCVARSTGTPSPLSPTPSPAGSVSSQTGSSTSSCGNGGTGSSVSVPHHIPTITSSFVNITSYILYAYDLWEQADVLARKNKKFFSELSAAMCSLSLNSSMMELVHYTRQGLQWLRLEPNTP
ncbi:AF4/FMR2 family member 1 isoform X3 [Hemicordylus capensis]|uniref:AF4/FMR2 family member 1 isoform X3 n=1 Tax=Hemicordylus capensis TaxID=884348 RepID=UPI002303FF98|nr:AF4/FMR2 family member 1 isoform X3 [Hemicordylus capensis]